MKKIFAFLFASALLATGLISCGGGGDNDDKYIVTAKQFENGRGIGFIGASPSFYIMPSSSTEPLGGLHRPKPDGSALTITESDPAYTSSLLQQIQGSQADGNLYQEGREVIQRRTVQLTGGSSGEADVSYRYFSGGYALISIGLSEQIVDLEGFIEAFGLQKQINNWGSDRLEVQTAGGTNTQFVIDWNSGSAQIMVNLTIMGMTVDENDEGNVVVGQEKPIPMTVSSMTTRVVPYLEY